MAGLAQRTHEVQQRVSLVEQVKLLGGIAHLLENNGDGALLAVIARDGQRHALSLFINAENNELPGLRLPRNQRGLNLHQRDRFIQHALFYDRIHARTPFLSAAVSRNRIRFIIPHNLLDCNEKMRENRAK